MNRCEKCGFLHYRTDPCRKPKESTAARKDVQRSERPVGATISEAAGTGSSPVASGLAGTQARPVDTNPGPVRAPEVMVPSAAGSTPAPGAKFDKKAWMREYMRDHRKGIRRRSKAKEDKQNG